MTFRSVLSLVVSMLLLTTILNVNMILTDSKAKLQKGMELLSRHRPANLDSVNSVLRSDTTQGQKELNALSQKMHSKVLKQLLKSSEIREVIAAAIGSEKRSQRQAELETILRKFKILSQQRSKTMRKGHHEMSKIDVEPKSGEERNVALLRRDDQNQHAVVPFDVKKAGDQKVKKLSPSRHDYYAYDVFAPGVLPSNQIQDRVVHHRESEFWSDLKSYEDASKHDEPSAVTRIPSLRHKIGDFPRRTTEKLSLKVNSHSKPQHVLETRSNGKIRNSRIAAHKTADKSIIVQRKSIEKQPNINADVEFRSRTEEVLNQLLLKSHDYNRKLVLNNHDAKHTTNTETTIPASQIESGQKSMSPALIQAFHGQRLSCTVGASGLECDAPTSPPSIKTTRRTITRADAKSRMSIGCAIPLLSENLGYSCHGHQHRDKDGHPLVSSVAFNLLGNALSDSVSSTSSPALRPVYAPLHNHGRVTAAKHHSDLEREGVSELVERIRRVQAQLKRYKQAEAERKALKDSSRAKSSTS